MLIFFFQVDRFIVNSGNVFSNFYLPTTITLLSMYLTRNLFRYIAHLMEKGNFSPFRKRKRRSYVIRLDVYV